MVFRNPRFGRDHPRIRGEHCRRCRCATGATGSSPHTRGARTRRLGASAALGIIPAYAGSTAGAVAARGRGRDHPRIRGEHYRPNGACYHEPGSSPHTRGAQRQGKGTVRLRGIIPAYAGSTQASTNRLHVHRDHPRIRGEHVVTISETRGTMGSSPHTRGAH